MYKLFDYFWVYTSAFLKYAYNFHSALYKLCKFIFSVFFIKYTDNRLHYNLCIWRDSSALFCRFSYYYRFFLNFLKFFFN